MRLVKPLLVYDGDCGFCRYWISRWKHRTEDRVEYAPFQSLELPFKQVSKAEFERSVKLFMPDGRVFSGAEAVFQALATVPSFLSRVPLTLYQKLPGFAAVCEFAYRLVAVNRGLFSKISRFLWGLNYEPPRYALLRWIFLRGLGVIYLIAFVSLWTQISGLVGRNGILPAAEFLAAVKGRFGYEAIPLLPTLCWLDAGDTMLHLLCFGGVLLSLLLIVGIAPAAVLFLLWLFYLSLTVAGQDFLNFQWDALLLETGFLAIFLAPLRLLPNLQREGEPSRVVVWLYRWLTFRLMFMSGLVKLTSGDPTWRDLTALTYHYETQPLPTVFGWFAHQFPVWVHKFSCIVMFGIEIVIPFLIFGPRRLRIAAASGLLFLQLLIFLTGNYCFFNLLAVLLCLWLLDDAFLPKAIAAFSRKLSFGQAGPAGRRWPRWVLIPLTAFVLFLSVPELIGSFRVRIEYPDWINKTYGALLPFRSVNGYGLFRVMTTSRPEIIIEGSNDGVDWAAYEFKYKAGDLKRAPVWVQPHQPRLDWQMWFAALGDVRRNGWFVELCRKLLQGSPDVMGLLQTNPFPEKPPRYLRAVLYDYRFTDIATLRRDGTWWTRERKGLYCPMLMLDGDKILPLRQ
jgi:predicted DCC family thiol-disulfide oxidoreductase YuxK